MKNKLALWLGMMFLCVTLMAQNSLNLIPIPQQMTEAGGSFVMGKVMLETPVWQDQWQKFVADAGGTIVPKSSRKIEVKLVPEVQGAKLNEEEA